jgi:hydroxypyruvate isomerase
MQPITRREALRGSVATVIAGITTGTSAAATQEGRVVAKGRLKQTACRWCYNKIPLPDLCKAMADMGLTSIDLLEEKDWEVATRHGLVCSMAYGGGGTIANGLNVKTNHDEIVRNMERAIPKLAALKFPNVITFFGNRRGMPDAEAIGNCVDGLNRIKKVAEDNGVTVCVELLNSKVDHKDYQGDRTAFGVEVVKAVGSPRVKLLYDIYHMQIMEGDVIRTIRDNREWIAHFHTGGVPGRHELDDTQELNWPAIASAIVETGYDGYFAHEFVPTRDPLTSLREAVKRCDV